MPTARERKQDKKAEKKAIEDYKWEVKKLCIERWKIFATIIAPLVSAIIAVWGISFQLESQSKLRNDEFQSQLFIKALERNDSNATLRNLVYLGALNDESKRYSFLIDDTIYMNTYTTMDQSKALDSLYVPMSNWDSIHTKPFCDYAQGSHFLFSGRADGCYKLMLDITTERTLMDFSPLLTLSDGVDSIQLGFDAISIPHIKSGNEKTLVYQGYHEWVKKHYRDKVTISSRWHFDCQ